MGRGLRRRVRSRDQGDTGRVTDDELIERFKREYQAYHGISPDRQREQVKQIERFAALCANGLEEATDTELRQFLSSLLDDGLNVNTVRKYGNMVRPFFTWMWRARIIDGETLMRVRDVENPSGSTNESKPRPYKRPELDTFWRELEAKYPRWKPEREARMLGRAIAGKSRWGRLYRHLMRCQVEAITRLALDCGMRRNEIFRALPRDLDPDNEYIVVKFGKRKNSREPRVREVPFTEATRTAVAHWLYLRTQIAPSLSDTDSTWLSLWGEARQSPMWATRFNDLFSKIGTGWELHRFRHTCGTEWVRADMDVHHVKELLGHAKVSQTLQYVEIVRDDIGAAMSKHAVKFEQRVGPRREAA